MKNEGQAFVLEVPKEVRNDKPTTDKRSRKEVPPGRTERRKRLQEIATRKNERRAFGHKTSKRKKEHYRAQKMRLLSVYFRKIFSKSRENMRYKKDRKKRANKKTESTSKNIFLKKIEKNV